MEEGDEYTSESSSSTSSNDDDSFSSEEENGREEIKQGYSNGGVDCGEKGNENAEDYLDDEDEGENDFKRTRLFASDM